MPRAVLLAALCVLLPLLRADDVGLIRVGEQWRFFKGIQEPPVGWNRQEFADGTWGESMAGFSTPGGYGEATLFNDYGFAYRSIYFRKRFPVDDPSRIKELILRLDFDDGCVVYLNGREVARRGPAGAPGTPVPFDALASPHGRGFTEEIDLTNGIEALRAGENLLAIQIIGSSPNDGAFVFVPELLANLTRTPYVQNVTLNSAKIVWKTLSPASGMVEFGTNKTTFKQQLVSNAESNHVARLENLEPDTVYFYRAGSRSARGESWTDWSSFKTFKPAGPITFTLIGDTGWSSPQQYQVAEQMRKVNADFMVHLGDLCYPGISTRNADLRFLSVYAPQMRTTPMFWAPGNHDAYTDLNVPLDIFYLPTNNATGTEHYYSFDQGDVHFTVIWSDLARTQYQPGSPQHEWIARDLAASKKPWKFLLMHHCWRTSAIHQIDDYDVNGVRDMVQLEAVAELASRYGVQIFFNGHDHCFERFTPRYGITSFLSGGGGAGLYGFYGKHPDTVQFYANYNFLKVTVDGDEATVQSIDESGRRLDLSHVSRSFPEKRVYEAAWNRPSIDAGPSDDFDGNVQGQTFDFAGAPIRCKPGLNSAAGRLFVNNDADSLYLGFDDMMLHDGDEVYLFIETPSLAGQTNLGQFGWSLPLTNFAPGIVVILGNELVDIPGPPAPAGVSEGAFILRDSLPPIPGLRLQQFNRSPSVGPVAHEQAANYAELALPLSTLKLAPGGTLRVAAVVNLAGPGNRFDQGGILTGGSEPLEVRLAAGPPPDNDGDGASDEQELAAGTSPANADSKLKISMIRTAPGLFEVSWQAVPGKWYTVQTQRRGEPAFRDLLLPGLPFQARKPVERVTLASTNQNQFFRIAVLPE